MNKSSFGNFSGFTNVPQASEALKYRLTQDDYKIPEPPLNNLKRIGSIDQKTFTEVGTRLSLVVISLLRYMGLSLAPETKILDWGCGCGRVLIPLSKRLNVQLYGCDVDETAIAFLKANLPNINTFVSDYNPPLPIIDRYFDSVYAFSVFSHLPKKEEASWLDELVRITRPGAILLLSVVGKRSLEIQQERGSNMGVTWKDVEREGFIFKDNSIHRKDPKRWPGVTGDYGLSIHHPHYIIQEWGKYFTTIKIVEAGAGGQDIVICTH